MEAKQEAIERIGNLMADAGRPEEGYSWNQITEEIARLEKIVNFAKRVRNAKHDLSLVESKERLVLINAERALEEALKDQYARRNY